MKKYIIFALAAIILLVGCGKNSDNKKSEESKKPAVTVSSGESSDPDTNEVTKDDSPANNKNTENNGSGNGNSTSSGNVNPSGENNVSSTVNKNNSATATTTGGKKPVTDTTTSGKKPVTATTTKKDPAVTTTKGNIPSDSEIADLPGYTVTTTKPLSSTTIIIDGDNDDLNIFHLGKLHDSGDTPLTITEIDTYSSSKPGIKGIDAFPSGDTIIMNIKCNPDVVLNSEMYIVREDTDHKGSYKYGEYIFKSGMYLAREISPGTVLFEVEVPDNTYPGNYELRFICNGKEEAYIAYHLGG